MKFCLASGFDFDKLFRDGLGYHRVTEKEALRSLVAGSGHKQESEKYVEEEKVACLTLEENQINSSQFKQAGNPEVLNPEIEASLASLKLGNSSSDDLFLLEYGFGCVAELMLNRFKQAPRCSFIGHNIQYDMVYFYNQFIGPLPSTFAEFARRWHSLIPCTFDTKVLAFKSKLYRQTVLGPIYTDCKDKRMKHILDFEFDLSNGFTNYVGADLASHAHEAGYDAYMTGYIYAKMLKHMQIAAEGQAGDLSRTPVRPDTDLGQQCVNLVMMSHLDHAFYSLDPSVKDAGAYARHQK